jgi:hypothetical protein
VVRRTLVLLGLAGGLACIAAAPASGATTVWAVGDGANSGTGDDAVAGLIASSHPGHFLYLGDVYERGTAAEYAANYAPSYGRLKAITSPTPGNHEWENRAQGYDAYWGPGVRQANGGHWYSFDLPGWHVVSLNSEEPMGEGSAQLSWLRADLARYPGTCTIAFEHRPRYSAGPQWNTTGLEYAWRALSGHAVALLSGHAHNYQRHLPDRGLVQFVLGTGGAQDIGNADDFDPRLAAVWDRGWGALRLRLGLGSARFAFVDTEGDVLDKGVIPCVTHTPTPTRFRFMRPKAHVRYPTLRTLYGRLARVRRVRLRLLGRDGKRCVRYDGKRFRPTRCRTPRSFAVQGTTRWRLKAKKGLPRGGWRLTVLARGLDDRVYSRTARFRVGRRQ